MPATPMGMYYGTKANQTTKNNNMLPLGMMAAQGAINLGMGMFQNAQQRRMMEQQQRNQEQLMAKSQQYGKEMWDYTNYENQVKHMKAAGLNPALAYGMGGGGGVTTGTQPGGQAASGQAAQIQGINIMDIQQQAANIKLMEANANAANAQAEKLRGYEKSEAESRTDVNKANLGLISANTGNVEADTKFKQANTYYQGIKNRIADATSQFDIKRAEWECNKAESLMKSAYTDAYVNDQTKEEQIKTAKANRIAIELSQNKIISETKLNNQKIYESAQTILQGWEELKQSGQQLNIEKFKAMMTQQFPNLLNVAGKGLEKGTSLITSLFGLIKKEDDKWQNENPVIEQYELPKH